MALKAITIDFWNTLFDSSNGTGRNNYRQKHLIQEIDKYGVSIKSDEFESAMKASWEYFNKIWLNEQRTPTLTESATFFWKQFALPDDDSAIENIARHFGEAILHHPPNVMSEVKEALQFLSGKYLLGIVSDTGFSPGVVLRELLRQNGLYDFFKAFSFSDETGVSKPHPKAFLTVLEQFKFTPEESLHIGDIEQTDIIGAKKLGMKAIRFMGDPTVALSEEPIATIADFEASSWGEIVDIINKIEK
ncbi:MAG: HAD family hydrolase [FCB group bacterium]|jgi:putative hydrolase of the HAD superfamily